MEKQHTTNYCNTFIEISPDSEQTVGIVPEIKNGKKSIALMQYEMIINNPYKYSSDEVIYQVFADRKGIGAAEFEAEKALYFSKGQPCFRASALCKQYGWGLHSDENEKIALYAVNSEAYRKFVNDSKIKKVKAMRSSR